MICMGCCTIHGSSESCDQARVERDRQHGYRAVLQAGQFATYWTVMRGDSGVIGSWEDQEIAEDMAALLNHAREWRAALGRPAPDGPR